MFISQEAPPHKDLSQCDAQDGVASKLEATSIAENSKTDKEKKKKKKEISKKTSQVILVAFKFLYAIHVYAYFLRTISS